jgi:putative intracellular protease/amidase
VKIAILLYEGFTALDCIGPYEVLSRLPDADVRFVSADGGVVRSDTRALAVQTASKLEDAGPVDIVLAPGGPGADAACTDSRILDWLKRVHETSKYTLSVCTGSLILAAAGILDGLEATSHWAAYERLEALGAKPVDRRVVRCGKIFTGAGVSAGIDLAFELLRVEQGDDFAQAVQLAIEYDPQPPFDSGSPSKAPAHIVDLVLDYYRRRDAERGARAPNVS